jgi:hypothetical protein
MANQRRKMKAGLKTFPIDISMEDRHVHKKLKYSTVEYAFCEENV